MNKELWAIKQAHGKANIRWIRAYLECLFDNRAVHVFANQQKQLELLLW
jgi:hypothetical protein